MSAIDEVIAKQAITEVLYRYCRGLDRMDRDMALSVWHPGATVDYKDIFVGTGEGFVEWVWPTHAALTSHSHQIANVLIDLDADLKAARSEAYVTATLRSTDETKGTALDLLARGRYLDRLSMRDGRWAIDDRIFVMDVPSVREMPLAVAGTITGRRDRDDPSFALFG